MMWLVTVAALLAGAKWGVAAAVLIWGAGYALSCWWFPWAVCPCCRGSGKHKRRDGKVFRRCSVCSGKGSWFRLGRVVWNNFTRARR